MSSKKAVLGYNLAGPYACYRLYRITDFEQIKIKHGGTAVFASNTRDSHAAHQCCSGGVVFCHTRV